MKLKRIRPGLTRVTEIRTLDQVLVSVNKKKDKLLVDDALHKAEQSGSRQASVLAERTIWHHRLVTGEEKRNSPADYIFDHSDIPMIVGAITLYTQERSNDTSLNKRAERLIGSLVLASGPEFIPFPAPSLFGVGGTLGSGDL